MGITLTMVSSLTTAPAAPVLSASGAGTSATLTWTAASVTGQSIVAGYRVYQASNVSGPYALIQTLGNVLTTTVNGLSGTTYFQLEGFDQFTTGLRSANSGPVTVQVSSSVQVNFVSGHFMLLNSNDGTGSSNNIEYSYAMQPNIIGCAPTYTWRGLEGTQGNYTIQSTIVQDLVNLNTPVASGGVNTVGRAMYLVPVIKADANCGSGAYTTANQNTFDGSGFSQPDYLIKGTGRKWSSAAGYLGSTDGKMYTTSFPAASNPNQKGYWMGAWNAGTNAYQYEMTSAWYHPVAAQCLLNLYQAIANTVVNQAITIGGTTYPANVYTLNTHPLVPKILCWDEEVGNPGGGGGGFLGAPPSDSGVKTGATNGTGGSAYVNPVNGTSVAGTSPVECYAYREQTFINSVLDSAHSNNGAAGFTQTGVSYCFSYQINSGNAFPTYAQLRTHLLNMYNGRIEFNGQDLLGRTYGLTYPDAVPWSAYKPFPQFASNGMYVGCHWDAETTTPGPGNLTTPTGFKSPAAGGFDLRGQMLINGFVGNGDLQSQFAQTPGGVNLTTRTTAVIDSIWNSAQFEHAQCLFWPRTSSAFLNSEWNGYIYNSDGGVVNGVTSIGVSGLTFNASQTALPTFYMIVPATPTLASQTSTSATINYTVYNTNVGTGMQYTIYVDGTPVTGQTSGTYTASGLAAGPHTFSVAMSNLNGTGSPSTTLTVTI